MSSVADRFRSGESVASGSLTLDREKAREKLQKFRLPDPHLYVLQFVRAASALGATRIEFTVKPQEVTCTFDAVFPPEVFDDLWGTALSANRSEDGRAPYFLALGLGSAGALKPAKILVRSGPTQLQLVGETDEVTAVSEPEDKTVIHLVEKFRFGHLIDFLRSVRGELAEAAALREHARFATLSVYINGERLESERSDVSFPQGFTSPESTTFVGLKTGGAYVTSTYYLQHGIIVAQRTEPAVGAPALIIVDSTEIQTDLSGMSAADETTMFRRLAEHVFDTHCQTLAAAVAENAMSWPYERVVGELRRTALFRLLGDFGERYRERRAAEITRGDGENALRRWLVDEPLFHSLEDPSRLVSVSEVSRDGRVDYVAGGPSGFSFGSRDAIDLRSDAQVRSLLMQTLEGVRGLGFPVINVTVELERRATAQRNLMVLQARPKRGLPRMDESLSDRFGAYELQVGLGARPNLLRLFVDGRKLRAHELLLYTGLTVDIDGPFELNLTNDDISLSREVDEVFQHAALLIERFVAQQATRESGRAEPRYRSIYLWWLEAKATGAWPSAIAHRPRFIPSLTATAFCSELQAVMEPVETCPTEPEAKERWLDALGEVSELPIFRRPASDEHISLRQIVQTTSRQIVQTTSQVVLIDAETYRREGDRQVDEETMLVVVRPEVARWLKVLVGTVVVEPSAGTDDPVEASKSPVDMVEWLRGDDSDTAAASPSIDIGHTFRVPTDDEAVEVDPEPFEDATPPLSPLSDPILERLRDRLLVARGDRVDLLGDALVDDLSWSAQIDSFTRVRAGGVELSATHPLSDRLNGADDVNVWFAASVLFSSINRYYEDVTDRHDTTFHRRLLQHSRDEWGLD